jgi:lysophospholipase L1-like esterase
MVENYSFSGAITLELAAQIQKAKLKEYAYTLVQIGANDIMKFHSVGHTAKVLDAALAALPKTQHLIVFACGNFGGAAAVPRIIAPFYTSLNLRYHTAFAEVTAKHGGTYINLYADPKVDLFTLKPDIYLAEDAFHPSSAGYSLWFEKIKTALHLPG